ncbi:MAG: acyl-CoA synthetase [Acidobacteria bacterium]|nr:acyl-CoA synthetase [Acidobacteriota bacterium]
MNESKSPTGIYDRDLARHAANHTALTPMSFFERAADVYPHRTAVVYGDRRYTWAETRARARALASALGRRGVGRGDTVAILSANIPEMFEAHFGVPMSGAVLNAINIRLDADTVRFILGHGEAKVLIVDPELAPVARQALDGLDADLLVVDIEDPSFAPDNPSFAPDNPSLAPDNPSSVRRIGALTYEELLAEGDAEQAPVPPEDEWDAIALNYTSGTTGNPKGVVYHHRGAYLNALQMALDWNLPPHAVYLWTLPMFHCNGWCFPWTLAARAGTSVCLRQVRSEAIFDLIRAENITHFCGAPIVLNLLVNAPAEEKAGIDHRVEVMTAGAAPPAAVIEGMEAMGFDVTHVYGLTETYGPVTLCAWQGDLWDAEEPATRAALKARQGVRGHLLEGLMVADPETLEPVACDGRTIGEVFLRGNNVMKGYLKNPSATEEAFAGGWFHSGDLAVRHADGYLQITDRSKDVIISGGENISSIEVEDVLYRHPDVLEVAVVAKPDEKWGEVPCAFVTLADGATTGADELIEYCRDNMAHFKAPKHVVFGPLPKTSTGKIQKFVLRERAADDG